MKQIEKDNVKEAGVVNAWLDSQWQRLAAREKELDKEYDILMKEKEELEKALS